MWREFWFTEPDRSSGYTYRDLCLAYAFTLTGVPLASFGYWRLVELFYADTYTIFGPSDPAPFLVLIAMANVYSAIYTWFGALISLPFLRFGLRQGYMGWGYAGFAGIVIGLMVWSVLYWFLRWSISLNDLHTHNLWRELTLAALCGMSYTLSFWLSLRTLRPELMPE